MAQIYSHKLAALLLSVLVFPLTVTAQQKDETDLSQATRSSAGEIKIFSDLTIEEGEIRSGAIRVIGGDLTVAGTVTGRITVLGGAVNILKTARVEGTIVAIGGSITRSPDAVITGEILEINSDKFSLSREENDDIFSLKDDESFKPRGDDFEGEMESHDLDMKGGEGDSGSGYGSGLRYNRAEGIYLHIPFDLNTAEIPGFAVKGYAGRAFGPGEWRARLNISQFLFNSHLGFTIEGFTESRTTDEWRVSHLENSLGAFFVHRDWYDWFKAEGYGGMVELNLPYTLQLKAHYRNEFHEIMSNSVDWSLFRRDTTFRPAYPIASDSTDVYLTTKFSIGKPVSTFPGRFQGRFSVSRTQTSPESDFDYTRHDFTGGVFLPIHRMLGIRISGRAGTIDGDRYGLQHLVPLGGIGSIQGYPYKSVGPGDHYTTVNTAFSLMSNKTLYGLHWHFGAAWNSADPLFQGNYFDELGESGVHSIGISIGDGEDFQLELFKPISDNSQKDWVFYLRLLDLERL